MTIKKELWPLYQYVCALYDVATFGKTKIRIKGLTKKDLLNDVKDVSNAMATITAHLNTINKNYPPHGAE